MEQALDHSHRRRHQQVAAEKVHKFSLAVLAQVRAPFGQNGRIGISVHQAAVQDKLVESGNVAQVRVALANRNKVNHVRDHLVQRGVHGVNGLHVRPPAVWVSELDQESAAQIPAVQSVLRLPIIAPENRWMLNNAIQDLVQHGQIGNLGLHVQPHVVKVKEPEFVSAPQVQIVLAKVER